MATNGQSLREEVSNVQQPRYMPNEEVQLCNAILEPMQPHVTRLGELGLHRPVGDVDCDLVVAVNDRRGLGVAEVGQPLSFHSGNLCGTKRAGRFCFLNRRTDDRNRVEEVESGPLMNVGSWVRPRW